MNSAVILGIESSCDDTSAAVIRNGVLLSNVVASQSVHQMYGGVVPELASRAHQQHMVPVVDVALQQAGVGVKELSAIAFTQGPGLLGSLLVGASFAKGLAQSLQIPVIGINHLQAHVMAHFLRKPNEPLSAPEFPFLCLLVSGGNSQIIVVHSHSQMQIVGQTIDDAAGEAFDKCAKVMGLPYPGGPHVDKLAATGNANAFRLSKPNIPGYDYSFSGLKTSFLYLLRDETLQNPNFVSQHLADLCASLQKTIVDILMKKLVLASQHWRIKHIAIAGGVSANSGLRTALLEEGHKRGWNTYILPFEYTTDNAAMIAMSGYFRYMENSFTSLDQVPFARVTNHLTTK